MQKKDEFSGLGLSKDLRDFYYFASLNTDPGFFQQFDKEFKDFVKRKSELKTQQIERIIGRIIQ